MTGVQTCALPIYLQYAHARLCSLFANAADQGIPLPSVDNVMRACNVVHPTERELVKICDKFPSVVLRATTGLEPHIVADYLREVAAAFHSFYHECRILGESDEVRNSRLYLALMARQVLHNGLKVLGVNAPLKM